jgi:hypothetical protein
VDKAATRPVPPARPEVEGKPRVEATRDRRDAAAWLTPAMNAVMAPRRTRVARPAPVVEVVREEAAEALEERPTLQRALEDLDRAG